ncbi:calcium-binding protein [Rhizobium sp. G21]|uniref:calcium-binding protein n=1 Tax=Rhizobium sp. G21 TaxID=2758439 RepID=UPI001FEEF577|nr:hypothetical protein [Rhizobium sp. G21]
MAIITGTIKGDKLTGTDELYDQIGGLDGNDTIDGRHGLDYIDGGSGKDKIAGSFQNDTIGSGDGDDTIDGDSGNDILTGGRGKDVVRAGSGMDIIYIGSAADGAGDVVDGGSGVDRLSIDYSTFTSALNIKIGDWISLATLAGGIKVRNVESFRLIGTSKNDVITGGNYNDELFGGLEQTG